jgi:molybdopterin molybdotransferase
LVDRIASIEADLIVTVGGASVGDYDLVKPALHRLGFKPDFDKIHVRPGKPTSFGRLVDGRLVLGLPGNPGSCLVMAQLLLKPFIRAALGQIRESASFLQLGSRLPANGPREAYLRAQVTSDSCGKTIVNPLPDQDSALISTFAQADVLIRRSANAPCADAGEPVPVIELERL